VESGKWKVESGKWKVESGKWKVESGKWKKRSHCYSISIIKTTRRVVFIIFVLHSTLFTLHLKVRMEGLEPTRLSAPDPKSGSATNYDTSANRFTKVHKKPKGCSIFGSSFLAFVCGEAFYGFMCASPLAPELRVVFRGRWCCAVGCGRRNSRFRVHCFQ
jgi:hypothetical protein